jgi:hypothetical protein
MVNKKIGLAIGIILMHYCIAAQNQSQHSLFQSYRFTHDQLLTGLPQALGTCKAYTTEVIDTNVTEDCLGLLNIELPNKTLNEFWEYARNKILNIICDKDGMIRYVAANDIATIKKVIAIFETKAMNYVGIYPQMDIIETTQKCIPKIIDKKFQRYLDNQDNRNFLTA